MVQNFSHHIFHTFCIVCIAYATALAQSNEEILGEQQQQYLASIFERDEDPEYVTQAFYGALERLRAEFEKNEAVLKQAYFDIIDILPPEKQKAWQDLQTNFEKVDFLREFWLGSDYTPATIVNERLIEHYARLRHARLYYTAISQKGYDDRGMIYIKYGEPDQFVDDVMSRGASPMTSWVYYRYGGAVSFDFIDHGFGYTLNSDLFAAARGFEPNTQALSVLALAERRIELSPDYARLYFALERIYNDNPTDPLKVRARFTALVNQHVVEVEGNRSQLPPAATDVLAEEKDLPCALSLAKFRGADGTIDLLASYGFRPADLETEQDTIDIRLKTALRAGNREILQRTDAPQRFLRTDAPAEQNFLRTESFSLLPASTFLPSKSTTRPASRKAFWITRSRSGSIPKMKCACQVLCSPPMSRLQVPSRMTRRQLSATISPSRLSRTRFSHATCHCSSISRFIHWQKMRMAGPFSRSSTKCRRPAKAAWARCSPA